MKHSFFIFSDVDGTLFSHEQCGIPKKSLLAIQKARENVMRRMENKVV